MYNWLLAPVIWSEVWVFWRHWMVLHQNCSYKRLFRGKTACTVAVCVSRDVLTYIAKRCQVMWLTRVHCQTENRRQLTEQTDGYERKIYPVIMFHILRQTRCVDNLDMILCGRSVFECSHVLKRFVLSVSLHFSTAVLFNILFFSFNVEHWVPAVGLQLI